MVHQKLQKNNTPNNRQIIKVKAEIKNRINEMENWIFEKIDMNNKLDSY